MIDSKDILTLLSIPCEEVSDVEIISDTSEISRLKEEAKVQMQTYLPNLLTMDIQIETYGTTLAIFITSESEEVYGIGYSTDTGNIGGLTLEDMR